MKLSNQVAALQKRKWTKAMATHRGQDQARSGSWRRWLWLALGLLVVGAGTLAVFEFFVWTKVPPALVGLWEINEGPPKGSTFEFSRRGEMEFIPNGGERNPFKARVVVRDKTLVMIEKDRRTEKEVSTKSTIRELTANTLILELENGDVLRMVRLE